MRLLRRKMLICSRVLLFGDEVRNLRRMFLKNSYPLYFCDLTLTKFGKMAQQKHKWMAINSFHSE